MGTDLIIYLVVTCEEIEEGHVCRFTTYRHRFARAAPAPRAKRRFKESWTCIARQGHVTSLTTLNELSSLVQYFNFELFAPFFLGDWVAYQYHLYVVG